MTDTSDGHTDVAQLGSSGSTEIGDDEGMMAQIKVLELGRGIYSIMFAKTGQEIAAVRGKRLARKVLDAVLACPNTDFWALREVAMDAKRAG